MNTALLLEDDAYAIAKAYADAEHCTVSDAASKLVVKSGFARRQSSRTNPPKSEIRFPLVRGARPITPEDVARLQDEA